MGTDLHYQQLAKCSINSETHILPGKGQCGRVLLSKPTHKQMCPHTVMRTHIDFLQTCRAALPMFLCFNTEERIQYIAQILKNICIFPASV